MNKEYKDALKKLEHIKKLKTDCLVRARRGEFWIKEHSPELNSVIRNLENTKRSKQIRCKILEIHGNHRNLQNPRNWESSNPSNS